MSTTALPCPSLPSSPLPGSCLLPQIYPNLDRSVAAVYCHGFAQISLNLWQLSAVMDLSKSA